MDSLKNIFLARLIFVFLLFVAFGNTAFSQDTDGDGVKDAIDLDDDNDGILDSDETVCTSPSGAFAGWSFNDGQSTELAGDIKNAGQIASVGDLVAGSGISNLTTPVSYVEISGTDAATLDDAIVANDYIETEFTMQPGADTVMFSNIRYRRPSVGVSTNNDFNYHVGVLISEDNFATSTTLTYDYFFAPGEALSVSYDLPIISYLLLPGTTYNVRYYFFDDQGNGSPEVNVDDMIYQSCTGDLDYDGDGIPNHLDTDSDDDGCPDAVEGGDGYTSADLINDRLCDDPSCVDEFGIPMIASPTQSVDISQDETNISTDCGLACSLSATEILCNGDVSSVDLVISQGGTPNFDIVWSGGGSNVNNTGLFNFNEPSMAAGTYTVTVSDNAAEVATCSITITEPAPIVLSEIHVDETICGSGDGTIDITWESGGTYNDETTSKPFNGAVGTFGQKATTTFDLVVAGMDLALTDETTITEVCINITTVPNNKIEKVAMTLIAPCGGAFELELKSASNPGGNSFSNVCFEPGAGTAITGANGAFTNGPYLPEGGNLDAANGPLTGCDPNGTWELEMVNGEMNDGVLGSWSITLNDLVIGNGPPDYVWESTVGGFGNPTTEDLTHLEAGIYTVTATDDNSCTVSQEVIIDCINGRICDIEVTSDYNGSDISCNGFSDGEATVTVTGSIPPFVVDWSTGANQTGLANGATHMESGLSEATYTVTVTDVAMITATCQVTLTDPDPVTASTSSIEPQCNGGSDGTAIAVGASGTPGYTYLWDSQTTSQTNAIATGLSAGIIYEVTVSDLNSCTTTTDVILTQPTQLVVIPVVTDISCNGGADGAISLTVSQATPGYTYIWSTLETTDNISGLDAAGAPYSVTVSDLNGCSVIETGTPAQPVAIDYATDYSPSACSQQDGEAFIVNGAAGITGGTSPYTYEWTDASLNTNTNPVFAGTYTVTVMDNANCTVSVIQVVQDAGAPTASILDQTIEVDCFEDCDGFITVQFADGAAGYTVAWPSGASTLEAVAGDVTENGLCAGDYIVTITDANDCVIEVPATITEPDVLTSQITNSNDPTCFNGTDGDATVAASGGTPNYFYLWSSNTTDQTTAQATTLGAGDYTVTVTDSKGCVTSTQVTLSQPTEVVSNIDGTPLTCFESNDGTVDLDPSGGTGTLTFNWTPNLVTSEDLSNVAAGIYDVEISDVNGCTATNTYTVTQPDVVTAAASTVRHSTCDEDCFDGEVTSVGTGGDSDYTYLWDDPANSITVGVDGVEEGTYCVTITDGNNCAASNCTVVLGEPGMIWVEEIVHILCYGQSTGEIALTNTEPGNGPVYTFNWTGPDGFTSTDQDLTGLAVGTHNVTIYDRLMVSVSYQYVVNEPTELQLSCFGNSPLCYLGTDGDVFTTASGGTSPYHYLWNNADADTTAAVDTLGAGIYNVVLTDDNGCIITCSQELIDPAELTVDIVDPKDSDCGIENGSLTAAPNGGTGGYNYLWEPADLTIIKPITLASGTHTVVVTDGNGCTASNNETLFPPGGLNPTFTLVTNVSCNGGSDGAATVNITDGASPYSYSWSTGGGDSGVGVGDVSTDNLSAGDISITVIGADMCEFTIDTVITQPDLLVTTATADSLLCIDDSIATIKTATIGGTEPCSFIWNNPTASTDTFALNVPGGTYTVTVTDDNDCIATSSTYIDPLTRVVASLSYDTVTCYEAWDGTLYSSATGGAGSYTYQWFSPNPDSATTPSVFEDISGNNDTAYWVIAVDSNMCISDTVFEFVSRPDSIRAHIRIDGDAVGPTPFEAVFIDSSYGSYYNTQTWLIGEELVYIDVDTLINTFSVNKTTSYQVILEVSRSGYCAEVDTAFIVVEAGSFLAIPDVFTPNGDEYNEKFMVTYINICELTGRIFNRWGEKLSQWDGVETGWDGRTFAGEEVPDGVYFYIIDAIGCDGKEYFDNVGTVTIIR
ncbi:MAG: gliding motility-associated C-terminal domain-containing protein [Flavobacteriales bacterium]|nr:gliding motility-associated C-terminal domain-containing protein [Flavobacteriales bacterium]